MTNESLGGDEIGELRSEINQLRADVERLKAQARAEEIVLGLSAPALPAQRPRLTILKGGLLAAAIMAGVGWFREHQMSSLAMVAAAVTAGLLVVWWPSDDVPRAGPDPPTVQTPPPSRPTVRPTPTPSAGPSLVAQMTAAQVTAPSRAEPRAVAGGVQSAEPPSAPNPTSEPPRPTPPGPTSEPTEPPSPIETPLPPPDDPASCAVRLRVDQVVDVCVLPSSAPRGAHLTHGVGRETPERQVPRALSRRPRQEALRRPDVRPQAPRRARRSDGRGEGTFERLERPRRR